MELIRSGMRVTYARGLKRVTLQRFLISRCVCQPDTVTFPELLALYDNHLWLEDKAASDPEFQKKFGSFLEKLSELLKGTRFQEHSYPKTLKGLSEKLEKVAEGHLIPERNLATVSIYVKGKWHVTPTKESGIPTRELPPKKVIGKGYRDKGTYRNTAYDGSPSWQELATYFARIHDEEIDSNN